MQRRSRFIVQAASFATLLFIARAAAAADPAPANPSDIAASGAAGGALIDKTKATSGPASGVAPKGTQYLRHANKERRKPAESAASGVPVKSR